MSDESASPSLPAEPEPSLEELTTWPPLRQSLRTSVLRRGVARLLDTAAFPRAARLAFDAGYLIARCRELGLSAALDLARTEESRVANEGAGKLDCAPWTALATTLAEDSTRLVQSPVALPALLHERLRAAGWPPDRITKLLALPRGLPRLRRIPLAAAPQPSGHTAEVRDIALTADGKLAVSASADGTLKGWDLTTGTELWTLRGHAGPVNACAVTADGKRVLSGADDGTLRVWDIAAASPDSPTAPRVLCDWSSERARMQGAPGAPPDPAGALNQGPGARFDRVFGVRLTPDEQSVFYGNARPETPAPWFEERRLDQPPEEHPIFTFSGDQLPPEAPPPPGAIPLALPTTALGREILARVQALGARLDELGRSLAQETRDLAALEASRSANFEAIAEAHERGEPLPDLLATMRSLLAQKRELASTVEAHKAEHLATYSAQQRAFQEGFEEQQRSNPASAALSAFAVAPGASGIAFSFGRRVFVGEIQGPTIETGNIFEGHADLVTACSLTPDGRFLVTASRDQTLRIWDAGTAQCLSVQRIRAAPATALAITPDGMRLVTASPDGLRVWDMVTFSWLESYPAGVPFHCLAATEQRVVAGDESGGVWAFDLADPAAGAPQTVIATGPVARRHALLVGIRAYDDKSLAALPYSVNDVREMERLLDAKGYAVTSMDDDKGAAAPHLLPTLENIRTELSLLRLAPNDLLLVHFSCHGIRLQDGRPYLLTRDSDSSQVDNTVLPVAELIDRMAATGARRQVLLLDACYAGVGLFGRAAGGPEVDLELLGESLQPGGPPPPPPPAAPHEKPANLDDPTYVRDTYDLAEGFAMLAASTAAQKSYDREDAAHPNGLFTSLVIEGLSGRADVDGKGFVTVDDLKNHVVAGTAALVSSETRKPQSPTVQIAAKGDMVLIRL